MEFKFSKAKNYYVLFFNKKAKVFMFVLRLFLQIYAVMLNLSL